MTLGKLCRCGAAHGGAVVMGGLERKSLQQYTSAQSTREGADVKWSSLKYTRERPDGLGKNIIP